MTGSRFNADPHADAGIDAQGNVDHVRSHDPAFVPHDRGLRGSHLPADLVTNGAEAEIVTALVDAVKANKAVYEISTPKIGGAMLDDGTQVEGKQKIDGGPSILYDAVALVLSVDDAAMLAKDKTAKDFVSDAFGHSKFIGYTADALPLIDKAGIGYEDGDEGLIGLAKKGEAKAFLQTCGQLRLWDRELTTDLDAAAFLAPAEA